MSVTDKQIIASPNFFGKIKPENFSFGKIKLEKAFILRFL
jgi:hypothetical protein